MQGHEMNRHRQWAFLFTMMISGVYMITPLDGQKEAAPAAEIEVNVGIILDYETMLGKMSKICISMALEDLYDTRNSTAVTKIVPHFRNSNHDTVGAVSAAIDLMKNVQVEAILGPRRSSETGFVISIGNKANIPIISQATDPSFSSKQNPYFIRTAIDSSSQARAIAAIVKAFGWRQVVFIYQDSSFGRETIPYLTDAMLEVDALVKNRTVLSPTASDDQILVELYKLKAQQTRVFVVHMSASLASSLFINADKIGMMNKGYAWIITYVPTCQLSLLDPTVIDSMQGVLGVMPYIPKSRELTNFEKRWKKKFWQENPDVDRVELNMFGLWAYDSVFALAMALEKVGMAAVEQFRNPTGTKGGNLTDLAAIGVSQVGPKLLPLLQNTRFKGLSGDFHVVDGDLKSSHYEIVNIIGKGDRGVGFWTSTHGISKKMISSKQGQGYTTNKDNFGAITWPGETNDFPKGWEIPTSDEKRLKVGVPLKTGFTEFVNVENDSLAHQTKATGFCIDVFDAVIDSLPYALPYDYIPCSTPNYTALVHELVLETFDAVVGDVTILADRSDYVDFTLPYTESGVAMIVPIKNDERHNAWIFLKPLKVDLWLTTGAFFIYTGIVVWVIEHRVNEEFRGRPFEQVGMIFWFSFSTLVFAHKEKMVSNLSRFVVIVWVFVVLVLTSSYTASLTSMLTVQQLQPTVTNIYDLMRKGEYIGFQHGSFVEGMLKDMKFDGSMLKNYSTMEEYDDALTKGSRNGGVSAVVDEIPYIRLFLSKFCNKYAMVGPTYRTAGFGFAFPKGSPLVPDVSTAVLRVTEEKLNNISDIWFGPHEEECLEQDVAIPKSDRLTLDSFKGLFLIAGLSSTSALIIFLFTFFRENREILASSDSIWHKLIAIARVFDEEKDVKQADRLKGGSAMKEGEMSTAVIYDAAMEENYGLQSPAFVSVHHEGEGFSTTEPGSPVQGNTHLIEERIQ